MLHVNTPVRSVPCHHGMAHLHVTDKVSWSVSIVNNVYIFQFYGALNFASVSSETGHYPTLNRPVLQRRCS
jgi:hypothetical protein